MPDFLHRPYRIYFLSGLLCVSLAAWFSLGYHQMDEHFMILEYARYRDGLVPHRLIPWEFLGEIRPSLQPYLAEGIFSLLARIGIQDPFIQTFLIRLLCGWLAFGTAWKFGQKFAPSGSGHARDSRWWFASIALLWFLPYLYVRFSSENMGGISLVLALICLPGIESGKQLHIRFVPALLCGLLLALSFFFRFQMAFAILGLLLWLLWKARPLPQVLAGLLCGAAIGVSLNLWADYSFYGHWVLTPYNYFHANIVEDVASQYGVQPWYAYIGMFLNTAAPPISILLLGLFFLGLVRRPAHPLVFIVVFFLLGHISVPHKELRFLYPVLLPFLAICLFGLESLSDSFKASGGWRITLRVLLGINAALLLFRIFTPAKPNHYYYRYLYHYPRPVHLITLGRGIYDEGYNEIFLYRPKQFQEDTLSGSDQLVPFLEAHPCDSCLVMNYQLTKPPLPKGYDARRLYVYLPDFVVNIQLNDWQSRSDIWSIWQIYRRP